jgi:hypothetical protein
VRVQAPEAFGDQLSSIFTLRAATMHFLTRDNNCGTGLRYCAAWDRPLTYEASGIAEVRSNEDGACLPNLEPARLQLRLAATGHPEA